MTQVFNTAQEARQWMVAHPMREVIFDEWQYRWNPVIAGFETTKGCAWGLGQPWLSPSSTVIDPEPTPEEWEEVPKYNDLLNLHPIYIPLTPVERLEYILTHASEYKWVAPEWSTISAFNHDVYCVAHIQSVYEQRLLYALQIGAKVSMKRREGV